LIAVPPLLLQNEREQCQLSAFAAVVRSEDEGDVLDADDDDQRPDDERQYTVDVGRVGSEPMLELEAFTKRVKRTRSDVAIDDTDGEQRQLRKTTSVWSSFGVARNCSEASQEYTAVHPGAENPKGNVN
jgi:hypothetical protein